MLPNHVVGFVDWPQSWVQQRPLSLMHIHEVVSWPNTKSATRSTLPSKAKKQHVLNPRLQLQALGKGLDGRTTKPSQAPRHDTP